MGIIDGMFAIKAVNRWPSESKRKEVGFSINFKWPFYALLILSISESVLSDFSLYRMAAVFMVAKVLVLGGFIFRTDLFIALIPVDDQLEDFHLQVVAARTAETIRGRNIRDLPDQGQFYAVALENAGMLTVDASGLILPTKTARRLNDIADRRFNFDK